MAFLVHHLLAEAARRDPHKAALIAGSTRRTFAELDADSDAVACALRRQGVTRGDRVAIMLENSVEYVTAFFGAMKAGAVYVPVNPSTKADKLAWILNDCGVRALVAPTALTRTVLPALAEAPSVQATLWVGPVLPDLGGAASIGEILADAARPEPADAGCIDQDLAAILYTSGTTGKPKGVMLTHANLVATARSIAGYLRNTPDDVVLCLLPLTFGYGLSQVTTSALIGFTLVLERSFAFPLDTLKRMVEHRITGLPGVPTVFATLLQMDAAKDADLSALRYLTNAAAPLPVAHLQRVRELFPGAAFYSMYGATECSTRIAYLEPSELETRPGSVGKAIPNCEAYVVDETGSRAAPGTVGELVVRGANVMRGYWNRPDATADRLRDGAYHTGDLFRADAQGFLTFVARKDDVFKCRGEKVSPKEVEAVLCELPDVAEAAVLGVLDPVDGMAVKAVVVPREGAALAPAAIVQHCRARLEGHMVPKFVEFRAELPKTESGKLKRSELAIPA
ncbi:AMP-binding protein [Azospirillum sp. TSO22-1]|uniref:class I adenylate-forming enzyme family protein n=1 Tax=Azospirillum sp. TSO22-1 TaxID=716789 RepID=UPI000D6152E4|nr:AMP-binding protein [Azospirillum sp. TSO22-1]PWC34824.1 long-chain fatty acid--CoA ligase [Azospirillum sp. TSO22-1]